MVINEINSDNLGDQAIRDASVRLFGDCKVKVADYSLYVSQPVRGFNPKRVGLHPRVAGCFKALIPTVIKNALYAAIKLRRAYGDIEPGTQLAVVGGGQLLLGGGAFPWNAFVWSIALRLKRVRYVFLGVGAGTKYSRLEKYLLGAAINYSDSVYVRDTHSRKFIKDQYGVESRVIPDLVFSLPFAEKTVARGPSARALICPIEYSVHESYAPEADAVNMDQQQFISYWSEKIVARLNEGEIVTLSATTDADYELAQKLFLICADRPCVSNIFLEKANTWEAFIALCSKSDYVMAGRMHALIFAKIAGCEIEPFLVSKKISSFVEEWASSPCSELRAEVLSGVNYEILRAVGQAEFGVV